MDKQTYRLVEEYMCACMQDAAHDKEHVYRVLYNALDIAKCERGVNYDILICACLLHDIGRKEQYADPSLDHAAVGGDKAYAFLTGNGFDRDFAEKVRQCIVTHRFRKDNQPESVEAKILFDADKLDVTGAMGIARTLVYKGIVNDPLYRLDENGMPSDGASDKLPSFFQEYKYKLENIYDRFYTVRGARRAKENKATAVGFYDGLLKEVRDTYECGMTELDKMLK